MYDTARIFPPKPQKNCINFKIICDKKIKLSAMKNLLYNFHSGKEQGYGAVHQEQRHNGIYYPCVHGKQPPEYRAKG